MRERGSAGRRARLLSTLFAAMLKIGLFTFGGGYAMIPLLEDEFVRRRRWLSEEEFLDMTAVAASAPGAVAINSSVYIGHRLAGVAGAVTAVLGACIPSVVVIFLISLFFDAFLSLTWAQYAFRGIRVCVILLILSAGLRMCRRMGRGALALTIFSAVVLCMLASALTGVRVPAVLYVLVSGCLGVAVYGVEALLRRRREGGRGQ